MFFVLKNKPIETKNNPIIWKYVQNKSNIGQVTFLDFTDIRSLLTFEVISAFKMGLIFIGLFWILFFGIPFLPFPQSFETKQLNLWDKYRLLSIKTFAKYLDKIFKEYKVVYRYTNADLKVYWYLCLHIKTTCRRFRIITAATFLLCAPEIIKYLFTNIQKQ